MRGRGRWKLMSAEGVSLILGVLAVAAGAALIWFFGHRADARRADRFPDRPFLEPGALWRKLYRKNEVSLESVEVALRLVSDATTIPAGKLRPTDRFAVELAPERGWEFDDGLAEIAWYLEAKSKGSSEGLQTVDDLIRLLDQLNRRSDPQTV
jgi:hypothetical protein